MELMEFMVEFEVGIFLYDDIYCFKNSIVN